MTRVTLVVHPVLDTCVHTPVKLQIVVSNSRVVENPTHVIHDFMFWHLWVVPGIDDAGCNVLQDHRSEFASRLVEYVRKVVLG